MHADRRHGHNCASEQLGLGDLDSLVDHADDGIGSESFDPHTDDRRPSGVADSEQHVEIGVEHDNDGTSRTRGGKDLVVGRL